MVTRRTFLQSTILVEMCQSALRLIAPTVTGASGMVLATQTGGADVVLAEGEPAAIALAYVEDASKVDAAKFSKYKADQNCASCALYQGGAKDASGGCVLFPGKQVKAKGWCSSWSYDA